MIAIGTDIVEIERIKISLDKGLSLAKRVLTEFEMSQFSNSSRPERYLAKRFAAKEAAAKALGTGIGRGISFQHFEIKNDDLGKPEIQFLGEAKERANSMGVEKILVTIADEQRYAVAFVALA